jgi:hypothetical protein
VAAPIPVKSQCILLFAKKFSSYKTQQLILGTGIAIWWLTEPHFVQTCSSGGIILSSVALHDFK